MSRPAKQYNARLNISTHGEITHIFEQWLRDYGKEISLIGKAVVLVERCIASLDLMSELDSLIDVYKVPIDLASIEGSDLFEFDGKVLVCIGKKRSMFSRYGIIKVFDEELRDIPQVWEV